MTIDTSRFPFRRHALALTLALTFSPANAATINVNGDCTLVNAIHNANSDADTDGANGCSAGSGADTLKLTGNAVYTLKTANNTTALGPNGLPIVRSIITINGNNATVKRSGAVSTPDFRLFHIAQQGNLTLNKLNLTNGSVPHDYDQGFFHGGGIFNRGILTLNNSSVSGSASSDGGGIYNDAHGSVLLNKSTVSGNSASAGGGIFSRGKLTLDNSTITGNACSSVGGGLYNRDTAILNNSTVSNNSAGVWGGGFYSQGKATLIGSTVSGNNTSDGSGGGITIFGGNMMLTNSTVSGNHAYRYGGGIHNLGKLTLANSTISGNSAQKHGGGISFYEGGSVTLRNSLIANSSHEDCFHSSTGYITLQGINIIEDGTCNAPISGDPRLGPLLDNGGITKTQALHTGSKAIDAADNALCTNTDQRHIKRSQFAAGLCDIGAFERMAIIPQSVSAIVQSFDSESASGNIIGIGNFPLQKLEALRNQLLATGHYRSRNQNAQACSQLVRTLERIDADASPDGNDYVTGSSGYELITQINMLGIDWICN